MYAVSLKATAPASMPSRDKNKLVLLERVLGRKICIILMIVDIFISPRVHDILHEDGADVRVEDEAVGEE